MKQRSEQRPTDIQRPSAQPEAEKGRVRDDASRPNSPKRSDETLPADRGAREQESAVQGSE